MYSTKEIHFKWLILARSIVNGFLIFCVQIAYHFAQIGVPMTDPRHVDNITQGLSAAIEMLTECSEAQLEKLKSLDTSNPAKVANLNDFIFLVRNF